MELKTAKNYVKGYGQLTAIVRDWRENIRMYNSPTGSYLLLNDVDDYITQNLERIVTSVHKTDQENKDYVDAKIKEIEKTVKQEVLKKIIESCSNKNTTVKKIYKLLK